MHPALGGARRRWEDWYAAVVGAAKHPAERGGSGKPLYSAVTLRAPHGAALYGGALDDAELPQAPGLDFVSPAIGISPFAVLTNVIPELAFIPGVREIARHRRAAGIRSVQVYLVPCLRRE